MIQGPSRGPSGTVSSGKENDSDETAHNQYIGATGEVRGEGIGGYEIRYPRVKIRKDSQVG